VVIVSWECYLLWCEESFN